MKISKIIGREVLDSRGIPTIEADVILENNVRGRAIVPSGKSKGKKEALELRDGNTKRYNGLGVQNNIGYINKEINNALVGLNIYNQELIDGTMIDLDGTENKKKLGANTILAVSMASCRAAANNLHIPLFKYLGGINSDKLFVYQMINVINGGLHANNNIDIQENMIIPIGANSYADSIRMAAEVCYSLQKILKEDGRNTNLGDEGGFAPDFENNEESFYYIAKAIKYAGYDDSLFGIALDVAASSFYNKEKKLYFINGDYLNSNQLIDYYKSLIKNYSIISIEDGMDEDDLEGWGALYQEFGNSVYIVGDDLFATNKKLFLKYNNYANSIIIKPNQIGTITETLKIINIAKSKHYSIIISHRSGDTEDTFISHLAVAVNAYCIKAGSIARSERVAKYNELIRINEIKS